MSEIEAAHSAALRIRAEMEDDTSGCDRWLDQVSAGDIAVIVHCMIEQRIIDTLYLNARLLDFEVLYRSLREPASRHPDIFTEVAAYVLHIGYMDVTPEQRREAKRQLFALLYGITETSEESNDRHSDRRGEVPISLNHHRHGRLLRAHQRSASRSYHRRPH